MCGLQFWAHKNYPEGFAAYLNVNMGSWVPHPTLTGGMSHGFDRALACAGLAASNPSWFWDLLHSVLLAAPQAMTPHTHLFFFFFFNSSNTFPVVTGFDLSPSLCLETGEQAHSCARVTSTSWRGQFRTSGKPKECLHGG